MIGVKQRKATIGLYHSSSHHHTPGERQLAHADPPYIYHLIGVTLLVLILAKLLVCCVLFIIIQLVRPFCHSESYNKSFFPNAINLPLEPTPLTH